MPLTELNCPLQRSRALRLFVEDPDRLTIELTLGMKDHGNWHGEDCSKMPMR